MLQFGVPLNCGGIQGDRWIEVYFWHRYMFPCSQETEPLVGRTLVRSGELIRVAPLYWASCSQFSRRFHRTADRPRTAANILCQRRGRTAPPRLPHGPARHPHDAPVNRGEPTRLPPGHRSYGRLAIKLFQFIRAPHGRRRICDHTRRRN